MKTFPPHKNAAGKKPSGSKSKNGCGHSNAKLNRHTQNHRLKAKALKPPAPTSTHKRDGNSVASVAPANAAEESNGVPEKEKEDVRNEYDQFLQVGVEFDAVRDAFLLRRDGGKTTWLLTCTVVQNGKNTEKKATQSFTLPGARG